MYVDIRRERQRKKGCCCEGGNVDKEADAHLSIFVMCVYMYKKCVY